jgi:hypothetical protein
MNKKAEEPKRKEPTLKVKRKLFLLSRNECYYPNCTHKMIMDGNFVGQIVHIEDAMPGGRFNDKSNNEERRSFKNLMLMCYPHHIETNNVAVYSVSKLVKMKNNHEQISEDCIKSMSFKAKDISQFNQSSPPKNLTGYFKENDLLDLTEEQKEQYIKEASEYYENISKLSVDARMVLASIINRAEEVSCGSDMGLANSELEAVICNISKDELVGIVSLLNKYGFIQQGFDDEFGPGGSILLCDTSEGWPIYKDLKKLAFKHQIDLSELLKNNMLELWDG